MAHFRESTQQHHLTPKKLSGSNDQDQNFTTPKILCEETCNSEIRENSLPRTEDTLSKRPESNIPISDGDLESLQSISELGSDSESWVYEFPEFAAGCESATVSALRQKIVSLEKVRSEMSKTLNYLEAQRKEEKKVHNSINESLVAKHDSLSKEHTQLKEEFESVLRALVNAPSLRLNQEGLQQKIDRLKDWVGEMEETQTARYEALETQICSVCSKNAITTKMDIDTSTIAPDTTKPFAELPATSDKKSVLKLLIQAQFKLEQMQQIQHDSENIQCKLEEAVSGLKLAVTGAFLERRKLQNRITELTQTQISNSPEALTLPATSMSSSSSYSPQISPFNTDTTTKTIAKLNHRLTHENARLTRAADSDATIRACQSDKINQLTQRCVQACTENEKLRRKLATLSTAHEKLEKAHAIAQEAYKSLERSAARTGQPISYGSVPEVAVPAAAAAAASERSDLVHRKGREVNASQSRAALSASSKAQDFSRDIPASLILGISERSAALRRARMAAAVATDAGVVAEAKRRRGGNAAELGVGQREDDYATPGNSDVEY